MPPKKRRGKGTSFMEGGDILICAGILLIAIVAFWLKNKDSQIESIPEAPVNLVPTPTVTVEELPKITIEELSKYNGVKDPKIYVALKNIVFDVSKSESYRPGGSYNLMAGRDASVSLARMSMEEKDFIPYNLVELSQSEMTALQDWVHFFENKGYPKVATITQGKKSD